MRLFFMVVNRVEHGSRTFMQIFDLSVPILRTVLHYSLHDPCCITCGRQYVWRINRFSYFNHWVSSYMLPHSNCHTIQHTQRPSQMLSHLHNYVWRTCSASRGLVSFLINYTLTWVGHLLFTVVSSQIYSHPLTPTLFHSTLNSSYSGWGDQVAIATLLNRFAAYTRQSSIKTQGSFLLFQKTPFNHFSCSVHMYIGVHNNLARTWLLPPKLVTKQSGAHSHTIGSHKNYIW